MRKEWLLVVQQMCGVSVSCTAVLDWLFGILRLGCASRDFASLSWSQFVHLLASNMHLESPKFRIGISIPSRRGVNEEFSMSMPSSCTKTCLI